MINNSQLRELYGSPKGRAKLKVLSSLEKHSKNFINKCPFIVISTTDKNYKLDASPRGGASGFVKVINDHTLVIPDAKGNNRIDSLSNIAETGQIGILFMIPGVDETLRVNGSAVVSSKQDYLRLFQDEKNPPKTAIVVTIEELFLHCAKAFMRSKLWDSDYKIERTELPTMGQMLNDQLNIEAPVESHEDMIERYKKDL
jgi:PPOX class probable FMN-dependent enzyme